MTIRIDLLMNALPVMGYGILGLFLITGVMAAVVIILKCWSGR